MKDKNALIPYEFAKGEITKLCDDAMSKAKSDLDKLPALDVFERVMSDMSDQVTPLYFMGYVSTDPDLRKEAAICEDKVGQFSVSIFTRKDIYETLKKFEAKTSAEKRLRHETLRSFEKNGLNLPDKKLDEVRELKKKLATLETTFSENLNNDKTTVSFTKDELGGLNDSFFERLKKDGAGKFIVTTKSTDYVQVMENAKNPETRKKMMAAYTARAGDANTKLLEEAIAVREKIATVMGYKTWADYRIQDRMAKDAEMVMEFLSGLKGKLSVRYKKDYDQLLHFKKEMALKDGAKNNGGHGDGIGKDIKLEAWDLAYLGYQLKKQDYSLDDDEIREYFPSEHVMAEIFHVYATLLGVKFEMVKDANVWASDVHLYNILENSGGSNQGQIIGHFYTDFVPREGKYGHAAAFPLIVGRKLENRYSHPVSAIVANFNPPSAGKPSLLNHEEVETLFHEFGHIMHQTLTRAPYGSLSGSGVAQDFVEAPSQMLENWVWDETILNRLSGHYKDPSKKLPKKLIEKLIAARDFNQGYFYMRQLFLGLYDMDIHTKNKAVDVTKTHDHLYQEMLHIEPLPGNHFAAGFGHLMGGYDAGYYGYLWSEVFAQDMFTQFEAGHILDPKVGARYRHVILEKGNMEEPLKLITEFLGRPSNKKAFFKRLGI